MSPQGRAIAWRIAVALAALVAALDAGAARNKAPSVAITAPAAGASYGVPATIVITATASDADGTVARVDFFQGTTLLGTKTVAPYSFAWTGVGVGTYSLTARATDNAGATATSAAVSISVTAPSIAIAQPSAGAVVYGSHAVVAGTFSGAADSSIVVDGPFGSQLASIDGNSYTASVPIVAGPNTLRVAVARRNRTFDTASVSVVGNLNPLLTFIAPVASTFDNATPIALEVDALSPSGTIARVDYYRGAVLLGSVAAAPYRFSWTNPTAGNHVVSATATDNYGYASTVSLPIAVSGPNAAPTILLTSPSASASFTAPASVPIAATASDPDGTVAKVEFLRDGAQIGVTNVSPYAMTWSGAVAGSYALTARATDDRGASTTSAPVTVIVKPPNAPPTVSLTAPVTGARFVAPANIALVANAFDPDGGIVRVDFLQGAATVASVTHAPYMATWSNVVPGTYSLTARVTDTAGATAVSAPVTIVVAANTPPSVTITTPSTGATYSAPADITVVASASDADGTIASVQFYQGSTPIGTATSSPYTLRWSSVAAGSYVLTARAADDAGAVATSQPVSVTVAEPVLHIEAPVGGATIAANHVHVQGAVNAPLTAGLVVNGVVAAVEGGRFYASNVPLALGANVLTATLTRIDGTTVTDAVAVTGVAAPITIAVGPTQGLAPLVATIAVTAQDGVGIAKLEVDANGDGAIERTSTVPPWETTISYLSSGTVNLRVRVTDTAGVVYTEIVPIVVTDRAAVDQRVRAVWSGMTAALSAGDTSSALTFLDALAQQRYGPVFAMLRSDLGAIVDTFSSPQDVALTQDFGEYAVNRVIDGQNRIFFIYFSRNGDGVWRLGSM